MFLDVPRTFPNNIYFQGPTSSAQQTALFNVLVAVAHNNPHIGYCQVDVIFQHLQFCDFKPFWQLSVLYNVSLSLTVIISYYIVECYCLQCFDAVGWAAGRASGL